MSLAQTLVSELDYESANTRKTLARVPLDRYDWRPHPKSFSLGQLANHLANLLRWGSGTMTSTEYDLAAGYLADDHRTTETLLASFDAKLSATRAAIAEASEADFFVPWTLRRGEQRFFTLPRVAVLRSMVFNHGVHHRGQLTVYLRQLDVPVPALYGPSADEA